MLDTGNFVLANQNSTILWGSFDQPTDTIIPAQALNNGSRLFARYTATNYSRGRFMFTLSSGNLMLYTTSFPQDYPYSSYWKTDTNGSGFQVIFNQSGSIYLAARNGTILNVISSNTLSKKEYQRATLDYDGVLRHYVYRKGTGSNAGVWSTLSLIPSNICMSSPQLKGGGVCGFNSLCQHDQLVDASAQHQGQSICKCPSGYTLMDPHDVLKGCKQNFAHKAGITEDWCRQTCLADSYCTTVGFINGNWHELKCFTYEELKEATNEFKEELGRGASATVFKGNPTSDNGKCVAVKILDANELEFNAEVGLHNNRLCLKISLKCALMFNNEQ
ncbi:unnamed protein product, partial [Prunus brigantina]